MKQFEHLNARIMRQPENEEQLVELENAVEEAKAKVLPSLLDEYEAGLPIGLLHGVLCLLMPVLDGFHGFSMFFMVFRCSTGRFSMVFGRFRSCSGPKRLVSAIKL